MMSRSAISKVSVLLLGSSVSTFQNTSSSYFIGSQNCLLTLVKLVGLPKLSRSIIAKPLPWFIADVINICVKSNEITSWLASAFSKYSTGWSTNSLLPFDFLNTSIGSIATDSDILRTPAQ